MNDLIRKFEDFQNRAMQINEKARKINGRLFLFDGYCPKHIPDGVTDDEVIFWYLVVDLYGLFFDAGRYLRFIPVWNKQSQKLVAYFYEALNEIRSVFCHNKPPTAYLLYHIVNPALKHLTIEWEEKSASAQSLLTRNFNTASPFRDLFDIYMQATEKILTMLENEVLVTFENYVDDDQDEKIYDEWFVPIFNWYSRNNQTVATRAWQSFCREKRSIDMHIVAVWAKQIHKQLTKDLNCFGHEKYCKLMYYRYFSLHARTADRRELTPFTLFVPLLLRGQTGSTCNGRQ